MEKKEVSIAYLLWGMGLCGICGLHRMYLGQYGLGLAMMFTFGLCGLAQLLDGIIIPDAVKETNDKAGKSPLLNSPTSDSPNKLANTKNLEAEGYRVQANDEIDELQKQQAALDEALRKLKS